MGLIVRVFKHVVLYCLELGTLALVFCQLWWFWLELILYFKFPGLYLNEL